LDFRGAIKYNHVMLFHVYSYFEHLCWALCGLLPPIVRRALFKAVFKKFGEGAIIDYGVYVRYPWKVSIGARSVLNRGCRVYPSYAIAEAEIVIGNRVAIGPEVVICGAGHDHTSLALPDAGATIRIHDHVWIGARSLILPGVEIGERAVVGAGSVVTRSLPPKCIAVGNPARPVKERVIASGGGEIASLRSPEGLQF
jgi:acetyltransferase-like isoleucine patch superfamily enzyme